MADEDTEQFADKNMTQKDYTQIHGTETTVQLFLSLPRFNSGISDLDETESVWQINWTRIHEPEPMQTIHTNDGKRIWFQATFRDATMQHKLYIAEKAALRLAGCQNADDFANKHANGKLWFPLICSLKIARKRNAAKPDDAASQGNHGDDYDS